MSVQLKLYTNYILHSLGSNVNTDDWPNPYNQHFYSDLTGTIRELTSNDNNDDTDTRFQPPLDTDNKNIETVGEGYRIASTELLAPSISLSIGKETSYERHKRDTPLDNSSISTVLLEPVAAIINGQISNNEPDDDSIINAVDANLWARSLSLVTGMDGSGSEESKLLFYLSIYNKIYL